MIDPAIKTTWKVASLWCSGLLEAGSGVRAHWEFTMRPCVC